MSEQSPYTSAHGSAHAEPLVSRPTMVSIIAVVCLILGLFALLYDCLQGAGMVMMESFVDMIPDEQAKKQAVEMNRIQFIPNVLQLLLGVVLAPLMVVGAVGVLADKVWGWPGLKAALIGFIIWNLLLIGITIYMLTFHFDLLSGPNIAQMGEESGKSLTIGINVGTMVMFGLFMAMEAAMLFILGSQSSKQWLSYLRDPKTI